MLSLLDCRTVRTETDVKGGRSPFILTLDLGFHPYYSRGILPRMEASEGRAAAQFIVRSVGIGEPSPTSIFCKIDRREIAVKKQGVYHLALLAGLVSRNNEIAKYSDHTVL